MLGLVADSVTNLVLTANTVARFGDTPASVLTARLTAAADEEPVADLVVVVLLATVAVLGEAATRITAGARVIRATFGEVASSVVNRMRAVVTLARFGDVAERIVLGCLTTAAALGEVVDLIARGCLTTAPTFGDAADRDERTSFVTEAALADDAASVAV